MIPPLGHLIPFRNIACILYDLCIESSDKNLLFSRSYPFKAETRIILNSFKMSDFNPKKKIFALKFHFD